MKSQDLLEGARLLASAFLQAPAVKFNAGEIIAGAGEPPTHLCQVDLGLACRCCDVADRRRAIDVLYLSGDIIGLEAMFTAPLPGNVVAAGLVRCRALDAASLRQMMHEAPDMAAHLMRQVFENCQRAQAWGLRLARLDAAERVAAMLLDIHDRLWRVRATARNTFNLRLTQQQIGDHLGLSGVHVNRVLRRLARERIAFADRYAVTIEDMPRLQALAAGNRSKPRAQAVGKTASIIKQQMARETEVATA